MKTNIQNRLRKAKRRIERRLGVVAGSLALVLRAGTRLRRVPSVLAMNWSWCGVEARTASYYSVLLWLLRFGLYQLKRAKQQADDWMWIVDHTVQVGEMLAVVGSAEHYVRHKGIHTHAAEELVVALPKPTTPAAKRLRKQLLEFVEEQARQARDDERLLGSSEVLGSIIGKFKYVAGERGQHGLTGMVLSIGALVGKQTVNTVHTALSEIPTREVWNWCQSNLGPTVQSVRAKIRQALNPEQKQKTLLLETG